jgi:hypothetical protein
MFASPAWQPAFPNRLLKLSVTNWLLEVARRDVEWTEWDRIGGLHHRAICRRSEDFLAALLQQFGNSLGHSERLMRHIPFGRVAVHGGHPFHHPGACAFVPATCHVPTQALTARETRRARVRRTSGQLSAICCLGAPRAGQGCIAIRLEGSPVRPSVGPSWRRICRPSSRRGHLHLRSVSAQPRSGSGRESRRRKSEARVSRAKSPVGSRSIRSDNWSEFPRLENRLDDRRGEDRMEWSHDILAACQASERSAGTFPPRACTSVPPVNWAFDP